MRRRLVPLRPGFLLGVLFGLWALATGLPATAATAAPAPPPPSLRDCAHCPPMVVLPAGRFTLGSADDEPGRDANEGPQKTVEIRSFAIGRYDVTRGEWRAFAAATHRPTAGGCSWASDTGPRPDPAASWEHLNFAQDDRHPIVCVSWRDAQDYAAWLSRKTHHRYRLPTEAEWEYAARAGAGSAFPWGASADHDHANYGADACCSGLASGRDAWAATSPVGAFPPNAFGLYDMNGEVLQWVEDCLHPYADTDDHGAAFVTPGPLKPAPGVPSAMVGLDACAFRILRGGDWGDPPRMIRSAYRNYAPPKGSTLDDYRSAGAGFRVVREVREVR